jgi:hypothetical protein
MICDRTGVDVVGQAIGACQIILDRLQLRGSFDLRARDDLGRELFDSEGTTRRHCDSYRANDAKQFRCHRKSPESMHDGKPLDERSGIKFE